MWLSGKHNSGGWWKKMCKSVPSGENLVTNSWLLFSDRSITIKVHNFYRSSSIFFEFNYRSWHNLFSEKLRTSLRHFKRDCWVLMFWRIRSRPKSDQLYRWVVKLRITTFCDKKISQFYACLFSSLLLLTSSMLSDLASLNQKAC